MRRNDKAEKMQSITMIAILIALIALAGFIFFIIGSKEESETISTKVANHNIFLYKQDGSLSSYNTKEKQYIEEHIKSNGSTLDETDTHINLFDISKDDNNIYVSYPFSKELIILSQQENELKETKRLKVSNIIENFKIANNSAFIHYLNNPNVEVYDLNSGELNKTITFEEDVTSIEVDEKYLYLGVGNYIEILPLENLDIAQSTKIHTGAETISILKSTDGFLYAANTFATDSGNSVLVKIDVNKKHVENILAIGKEYPISMFERENYLYILCQGVGPKLDGLSIIDKNSFEKFRNVSTGETPNSMTYTEDGYIYVAHEDGSVAIIDAKNDFNKESSITINGVKNILIK